MFEFFGGGKIVSRMADELGIERSLFKTALTEEGINFAIYKIEFQAATDAFPNEGDRIAHLARHSINPAYRGLLKRSKPNFRDSRKLLLAFRPLKRTQGNTAC